MLDLRATFGRGWIPAEQVIRSVSQTRALWQARAPKSCMSLVRSVRVTCYCIVSFMLSVSSGTSYAQTVPAIPISSQLPEKYFATYGYSGYDPQQACVSITTAFYGTAFSSVSLRTIVPPRTVYCQGSYYGQPVGDSTSFKHQWKCADGSGYQDADVPLANCTKNTCPANSTGAPATNPSTCTCNANYLPDTSRTSCVPASICPVADLPPITDSEVQAFENNPNLSDTARLTPRMQTALQCLQTATAAGSPKVGSAYRPPAYNQHLIDVWDKWDELKKGKDLANPACAELKTKIRGHFQRHSLLESQRPVPNSPHTRGEAVDMTISLPAANIDALAAGCQLRRPAPVTDRVHFTHR